MGMNKNLLCTGYVRVYTIECKTFLSITTDLYLYLLVDYTSEDDLNGDDYMLIMLVVCFFWS